MPKSIFEPFSLGRLGLKNRIVRSATDEHLATDTGLPTEALETVYRRLAEGGTGLIITGHLFVDYPLGQSGLGQAGIYDDSFAELLKPITQAGKRRGCKIAAQISHAGAKYHAGPHRPVAPSAMRAAADAPVPRRLTQTEIEELRKSYVDAASRAAAAGFDGVQVHCAHGYLLSEFVDPYYNPRVDEYGGSVENRMRLPLEIIRGIKAVCGEDYPVLVKVNSNTRADDEQYGEQLVSMVRMFAQAGAQAVELSGYDFAPKTRDRLYFLDRAAQVKAAVPDVPLILVGGLRSVGDMQKALDAGIDLVAMCRPLVCQPDAADRFGSGQETSPCVSCNRCFQNFRTTGFECAVRTE